MSQSPCDVHPTPLPAGDPRHASGPTARPRRAWREFRQWRVWLTGLIGSRYDGLAHFAIVTPGVLMRCGQPRLSDLDEILERHGLRTIICARGGTRHPLRGAWFRRQRGWCQRRNVCLEHLPFSDKSMPPASVFDRFLVLLDNPDRRPILVHCEQGFHRTGILCAAYRVAVCGWSLENAVDEMVRLGFELHAHKRRGLLDALSQWAPHRRAAGS